MANWFSTNGSRQFNGERIIFLIIGAKIIGISVGKSTSTFMSHIHELTQSSS